MTSSLCQLPFAQIAFSQTQPTTGLAKWEFHFSSSNSCSQVQLCCLRWFDLLVDIDSCLRTKKAGKVKRGQRRQAKALLGRVRRHDNRSIFRLGKPKTQNPKGKGFLLLLGSLGLFFLFAFLTRAVAVPKDVLGERGKGKGTRNEEKERERQKSLGRENEGKLVETQEGGRKRKNKCHARSFRSFQYKCKPQAASRTSRWGGCWPREANEKGILQSAV